MKKKDGSIEPRGTLLLHYFRVALKQLVTKKCWQLRSRILPVLKPAEKEVPKIMAVCHLVGL